MTTKNLGIWMDHSAAHVMELTVEPIVSKNIISAFNHEEKEYSLSKSENLMHNKEQHLQSAYYKKLGAVIKDYDDVVLFGPTDAKAELFNLLQADHQYKKIKIETKQADKMTENEEHAFVRDYFSKR